MASFGSPASAPGPMSAPNNCLWIYSNGIVVLLALVLSVTAGAPITQEQNLMRDLFRGYNPVARPVMDASDTPTVYISFVLSKLDTLNLKMESLVTSGYLRVTWVDERLTWNPVLYGDIEYIVVSPLMVWLPDYVLYNRVGSDIYTKEHYSLFRVTVRSNGSCRWLPAGEFRSKCAVSVQYFPFDTQQCSLIFGNWMYSTKNVNLSYREHSQSELLAEYAINGEWDLTHASIHAEERIYEEYFYTYVMIPYPEVHFTLTFQRKSLYYIMNIVVPSVILSALVLTVLWLPPDSGEKMSMGVTLLLSFTVFLLMVSENVPNTSEAVPMIVIYVLTVMGVTALSVTASVCTLIVHHCHVTTPPPDRLVKMASFLLKKSSHPFSPPNASLSTKHGNHHESTNEVNRNAYQANSNFIAKEICVIKSIKTQSPGGATRERILDILAEIYAMIHIQSERHLQSDQRKERAVQWRVVAEALDRLFFWIILVILVVCSMSILVILPQLDD